MPPFQGAAKPDRLASRAGRPTSWLAAAATAAAVARLQVSAAGLQQLPVSEPCHGHEPTGRAAGKPRGCATATESSSLWMIDL